MQWLPSLMGHVTTTAIICQNLKAHFFSLHDIDSFSAPIDHVRCTYFCIFYIKTHSECVCWDKKLHKLQAAILAAILNLKVKEVNLQRHTSRFWKSRKNASRKVSLFEFVLPDEWDVVFWAFFSTWPLAYKPICPAWRGHNKIKINKQWFNCGPGCGCQWIHTT